MKKKNVNINVKKMHKKVMDRKKTNNQKLILDNQKKLFLPPKKYLKDMNLLKDTDKNQYPLIKGTFNKRKLLTYFVYIIQNLDNCRKDYLYALFFDKSLFHKDYYHLAIYHFFKLQNLKNTRFTRKLRALDVLKQIQNDDSKNNNNESEKMDKKSMNKDRKRPFWFDPRQEKPLPFYPYQNIYQFSDSSTKNDLSNDDHFKGFDLSKKMDEFKKNSKDKMFKNKYEHCYYSALDIETCNIELSKEEAEEYFGNPSVKEELLELTNLNNVTPNDSSKRVVQIPVLIGYTHIVHYSKRKIFTNRSDEAKTEIFEIESLKGSNKEIILYSLNMMQCFWKSLKTDINPIMRDYEKRKEKNKGNKKKLKGMLKSAETRRKKMAEKSPSMAEKSPSGNPIEFHNNSTNENNDLELKDEAIKGNTQINIETLKADEAIEGNTQINTETLKASDSTPKPKIYIYAHNMGRYDGIFLLRSFLQCGGKKIWGIIPKLKFKGNTLIRMNFGNNVSFLDSFLIMNSSLNNIAKTMLNKEKMDMEIQMFSIPLLNFWKDNKADWFRFKQYLARDCSLLIDIIHTLADMFFNIYNFILGDKSTISGTALEIFLHQYYTIGSGLENGLYTDFFSVDYQTFLKNNRKFFIHSLTSKQEAFVRKAFFGGRTEVYETFAEDLKVYDINSAYCAAMVNCPMPTGEPKGPYPVENSEEFFIFELDKFFGFIEATVTSPPDIDPPVLPYKEPNGTLLYPIGCFKGYFFSEELKLAKKYGYLIDAHSTISFTPNKHLFKNFIEDTYSQRIKHPKNSPENLFFKIIMLSVFGRFALNPSYETFNVVYTEAEFNKQLNKETYLSHESLTTLDNKKCFIVKHNSQNVSISLSKKGSPFLDSKRSLQAKVAPQISAAISSYVRINLYDILKDKNKNGVAYTDTDSVFMKQPMSDNKISSTELGLWDYEGSYDYGMFVAKKMYKLFNLSPSSKETFQKNDTLPNLLTKLSELDENNITETKIGAKGIPPNYLKDISHSDWLDLLESHPVNKIIKGSFSDNKLKMNKSYQTATIELKPTSLSISNMTLDRSRSRVFDQYGNCITTQPFQIFQQQKNTDKNESINYSNFYYEKLEILKKNYPYIYNDSIFVNKKDFLQAKSLYYEKKWAIIKKKLTILKGDSQYISKKQPITSLFSVWRFNEESNSYSRKKSFELDSIYQLSLEKVMILTALDDFNNIKPLPTRYLIFLKNQLKIIFWETYENSGLSPREFISTLF